MFSITNEFSWGYLYNKGIHPSLGTLGTAQQNSTKQKVCLELLREASELKNVTKSGKSPPGGGGQPKTS